MAAGYDFIGGAAVTKNMRAFLDAIAFSEIGPTMLAMPETDDGYKVIVGSTPKNLILMDNYISHPQRYQKAMNSDAAGRYQFMGRYWPFYRRQLNLPDFGPDSQDRWAIQLIKECRALHTIEDGKFALAVEQCKSRWASFPGAGYSQPEHSLASLTDAYTQAGGTLSEVA